MAHEVEWPEQALRDVEDLADFIGRTSPQNASRVVEAIRDAALHLDPFPLAHRIVPKLRDPELRETFVYRWRLMYRVREKSIRIVGVVHGARLLANDPRRSFEEAPQLEDIAS